MGGLKKDCDESLASESAVADDFVDLFRDEGEEGEEGEKIEDGMCLPAAFRVPLIQALRTCREQLRSVEGAVVFQ